MDNPYRPPGTDFENQPTVPLSLARPTAATVFGILNLIFGGLALVSFPLSLAMTFIPVQQPGQQAADPALQITKGHDYRTGLLVLSGLGMVAATVEIIAGIGLLKLKPWGRTLSIGYGAYSLLQLVAAVVFQYAYLLQPLMNLARANNTPQMNMIVIMYEIIVFGSPFLGAIYPILLLIFMTRPKVVAAYRPRETADPFGPAPSAFA